MKTGFMDNQINLK